MRPFSVSAILINALVICAVAAAQEAPQAIDDANRVTLGGNTRSEAMPANDRGAVDPAMPLDHLELQLRRTPDQEREVESFIEALHDPASPSFHQRPERTRRTADRIAPR